MKLGPIRERRLVSAVVGNVAGIIMLFGVMPMRGGLVRFRHYYHDRYNGVRMLKTRYGPRRKGLVVGVDPLTIEPR